MDIIQAYLINAWNVLAEMAPWLLLGAGIAGLLHIFLPGDFIHRHLGKSSFSNVAKAVFFGVPMPLCSCGVIPAALGLKKDGASDGASVGFLISTPQTGIDSIFVSASFLGWPFALFKVVSAFITGLLGGWIVNITTPQESASSSPSKSPEQSSLKKSYSSLFKEFWDFVFGELIYTIWKLIMIGILVSAAITTLVPANALADSPLVTGIQGKLIVLVFSLGLYVCATGSVPIAASLVAAGMPMGSALVFLMAGPATNVATMGAVMHTFGKRVLGLYLLVLGAGSILLGHGFDLLMGDSAREFVLTHQHGPSGLTHFFGGVFAVLLLWYAVSDLKKFILRLRRKEAADLQAKEFTVQGMTCQMCVNKVTNALKEGEGVRNVSVDLKTGKVKVSGRQLEDGSLISAIQEKGYKVVS
jgi:uncharacterized membrane protein YraQ (UPF0718 family)/copper chaperone CopZ